MEADLKEETKQKHKRMINRIGEPILQRQLQKMYDEKIGRNIPKLEQRITDLESELELLKKQHAEKKW